MIKNSTYIRNLTAKQRKQLETVAAAQKLKTAPKILFYTLNQFLEQQKEIARLNRIIQYKQNKIDKLTNPFSLQKYSEIDFKDLQKVSFIYEKINDLICGTESINEDIIDFMLKPFEEILKHHGVNLIEQDF
jgi:hypothetical protein